MLKRSFITVLPGRLRRAYRWSSGDSTRLCTQRNPGLTSYQASKKGYTFPYAYYWLPPQLEPTN